MLKTNTIIKIIEMQIMPFLKLIKHNIKIELFSNTYLQLILVLSFIIYRLSVSLSNTLHLEKGYQKTIINVMKASKFDFKKHQNYHKSWKMLLRFIIYGTVIFLLLYFTFFKEKAPSENSNDADIEVFEVEITPPQSE